MAKIVISYRHSDAAGTTRAIFERLQREYGEPSVFMDVDIPFGTNFVEHINKSLYECDVMISIIGPKWLRQRRGRRPREGKETDYVQLEIETALQRKVVILPIRVDGASMPSSSQVPEQLHEFCLLNAAKVDSGRDFPDHMRAVIARIDEVLAGRPKRDPWDTPGDQQPGIRDLEYAPEMVRIPRGRFTMGAAAGERASTDDERPQHEVVIARDFAVARFPVTLAQWASAVAENGVDHVPRDHGWKGGDRPVIDVSWDDVQQYVRWLSHKTKRPYRLLTEAEWEYAARAGSTTLFWWGDTISSDQANFNANYAFGNSTPGEYRGQTLPVATFQPNAWGLFQVHGNIWEWCQDRWFGNYDGAPRDGAAREEVAPVRAGILASIRGAARLRVVRGGSWKAVPKDLRSARRMSFPQDYRANAIGFRLACDL